LGAEDFEGALAGGDDDGVEALAGQERVKKTALGRIVIHDEDGRLGVVFGSFGWQLALIFAAKLEVGNAKMSADEIGFDRRLAPAY